jgi:hypothetical protein
MDFSEISCGGLNGCNWFRVWINVGINEHADKPLGFTADSFLVRPNKIFQTEAYLCKHILHKHLPHVIN